jgi:hypothetical protein
MAVNRLDLIPYNLPSKGVIGNDWGTSVTFADDIALDTFDAAVMQSGAEIMPITCTVDTVTKTVALSLTEIQTATLGGTYQYYFNRTRAGWTTPLLAGELVFIPQGATS